MQKQGMVSKVPCELPGPAAEFRRQVEILSQFAQLDFDLRQNVEIVDTNDVKPASDRGYRGLGEHETPRAVPAPE